MNKYKVENRLKFNILIIILIIVVLISLLFSSSFDLLLKSKPNIINNNSTQVHFIDVGQGDAIAIKLSNGKIMLVDSGTSDYNKKLNYYLDNIVLKGSKTIDYLVLTHPDSDHMGNMLELVEKYSIGTFIRPRVYTKEENILPIENSRNYSKLISILKSNNTNIQFCDEFNDIIDNNLKVSILTHICKLTISDTSTNKYSPVIIVEDNDHKVMLTGDINSDCEKSLVDKYGSEILDIDVLKLAHHGSNSSTSRLFLENTSPQYVVVSVGDNNYGHPSNDMLLRLIEYDNEYKTNLYGNLRTTKENGNIIVSLGEDIYFETINNIDDYSFYSYTIYAIVIILILICKMILPYYVVWKRNYKFNYYNKHYNKYASKENKNYENLTKNGRD